MPRRDLRYTATSPEKLDQLAKISEADIERAHTRWNEVAPADRRGLADAELMPEPEHAN